MANVDLDTGEILLSADVMRQSREDMTDDEYASMLLVEYEYAVHEAKQAYENRDRLQHLIFQYMDERGANGIPSDMFECVRKNDSSYPRKEKTWLGFFDIFSKDDIEKCYTPPAHGTGTWNTTTVKSLANIYGHAATQILENTRETSSVLSFKRKEKKNTDG